MLTKQQARDIVHMMIRDSLRKRAKILTVEFVKCGVKEKELPKIAAAMEEQAELHHRKIKNDINGDPDSAS